MQKNYHTKCKEHIQAYLETQADKSFSAYDVYDYIQEKKESVNLTTVYRNLDKLTEQNVLMKYKTSEDESFRYQFVRPHGNCKRHIHMQCRNCGKLFHLECAFMEELSGHLLKHHNFLLECSGTVLNGLCGNCRIGQ